MKKTAFLLAAALLTAAACTRELTDPAGEGILPGQRFVTLNASAESAETRVTYAEDRTFGWETGDQIAVWTGSDFSTAAYAGESGAAQGPFTLAIGKVETYSEAAIYPCLPGSTVSQGKVNLLLGKTYSPVNPESVLMPLVARIASSDQADLAFKHVGAAVKVTFKNLPEGDKTFRLLCDKGLTGSFEVDLSELGTASVAAPASDGQNNYVDISFAGNEATELTVYFPVPTGDLRFGVEVIAGGNTVFRKEVGTKVNTLTRGMILRMPEIVIPDSGRKVLLNGTTEFATVQAAVDAAADGDVVTASEGVFDEHVTIDEKAVTLEGAGAGTVINSVEIYKAASTVRNLTVNVVADVHPAGHSATYQNTYGLYLHRAGYGAVIENVVFNMEDAHKDATAMFLVNNADERGTGFDTVKGCVFNGVDGKRNAQLYGARAKILDNTFSHGHAQYCIRIGSQTNVVVLDGNSFKDANGSDAAAVQFNNMESSYVDLGDNTQDGSFRYLYAANNVWLFTNNNEMNAIYGRGVELIKKAEGRLATRAWGYYNAEDAWDDAVTTRNEWNRNAVMTATKIYVAIAGAAAGQYGIAVFDRKTSEYEGTITSGFEQVGTFWTCGITRLGNKIFVCNLARDGQALKIYELDTDAQTATKVIDYTTSSGVRYGDVMTSAGDMGNGLLGFVNYYSGGYIEFRVTDGVWNDVPVAASTFQRKVDGSEIGGIYILGNNLHERNAVYASNKEVNFRDCWTYSTNTMDGWYGSQNSYWFSTNGTTESNMASPRQFWYSDDNKYMAYVSVKGDVGTVASGYLRIVRMTGETHLEQWLNLPNESVSETYPIGSADNDSVCGTVKTNHQGFCDIYSDDYGNVYILAGITECGMSLFKMN